MAEDINKKINIDVQVNTDGQQQITQYKAAFDDLRNSINSIKNPLNNISGDFKTLNKTVTDISGSLNKLNSTASSFNSTGSKIGGIVNTAIGSFLGLDAIFTKLELTFGEFTAEFTGGLSLLISFLPVIVDWVGGLFKADTTTKSLNQTLKEHKLVVQAVNQARLQGDQNAQQELVHLKLLFGASQDQKLSLTEHKKAVVELQQQYPGYLGNISFEAILTGKATTEYNKLTQAILASSRAKAAQDMIVKNSERQLGDEATVTDLKEQRDAKQAELNETIKKFREQMAKSDRGRVGWNDEEYVKYQLCQMA